MMRNRCIWMVSVLSLLTGAAEAQDGKSPQSERFKPAVAVKSNLLYDLTATINLGVEVPLSRKLSIDLPANYNPWTFGDGRKWKHWLVQPSLRYWPTRTFRGSFWGAHGHVGGYNVARVFGEARYQGWLVGGGISYGYRWNLAERWGLEAEIGVGYARLDHTKYSVGADCPTCGTKLKSDTKNYLGVTKAAISLVYTFGKKRPSSLKKDFAATWPTPLPPITGWERELDEEETELPEETMPAEPTIAAVSYRHEMGRACVWFPVNKSTLHPDMENNRSELLKIGQSMKTVRSHPASEIKKIQIDAYASPEGDETRNRELSLRRAEALKGYMKEAYQLPDSLFAVSARGENWEGLAEAIRLDESLTDTRRAELLRIVEADDEVATRKARLKSHQGGQSYQWLLREVFPLLRVSEYRIDYTLPETATNPDRELD